MARSCSCNNGCRGNTGGCRNAANTLYTSRNGWNANRAASNANVRRMGYGYYASPTPAPLTNAQINRLTTQNALRNTTAFGNTIMARYGGGCGCNPHGWNPGFDWNGCHRHCHHPVNDCFPYYSGPCGPTEPVCGCNCHNNCGNNCGCSNNCSCDCNCDCSCDCDCGSCSGPLPPPVVTPPACPGPFCTPIFGYFTQVGTLDVGAGGPIPFNGGSTVEGIWKDGGTFTLEEEGVYLMTLNATVPEAATADTDLTIRVNGVALPGSTLQLDKVSTDEPLQGSTQAIITVNSGAVVTVTSSAATTLTADDATNALVTLTILKIG